MPMTPQQLAAARFVYVVSPDGVAICKPVRLDGDLLTVANGLGGEAFVVRLANAYTTAADAKDAAYQIEAVPALGPVRLRLMGPEQVKETEAA